MIREGDKVIPTRLDGDRKERTAVEMEELRSQERAGEGKRETMTDGLGRNWQKVALCVTE